MTWGTSNTVCHRTCSLQDSVKKYSMEKWREGHRKAKENVLLVFQLRATRRLEPTAVLGQISPRYVTGEYRTAIVNHCVRFQGGRKHNLCSYRSYFHISIPLGMLFQGRDSALPILNPSWALAQHCTWICTDSSYSTTATMAEISSVLPRSAKCCTIWVETK